MTGRETAFIGSGDVLAHSDHGLEPFTPVTLFTHATPLAPAALLVYASAGLYLWGVFRMRARGDRWPAGRTATFLIGLVLIAAVTASGLERYDTTLLSVHMLQHMVLSMLAPIFLALGAPVTLALRTLPPGPRAALLRLLHSRFARVLTFPLLTFGLFIASPFALYFSGLYRLSLEYPAVHEFVHVHLIVVGCLFFWPLIGLDPLPGRLPYPMRALLMFLSTPFHTVLGLTVMQSSTLLGGDWYPSLGLDWVDPYADQNLAGGMLWAGGEFVAVAMLGALVFQWIRESEREARRVDRALDRAEAMEPETAAARTIGGSKRRGERSMTPDIAPARPSTVLLYSDDAGVREIMRLSIGTRPAADLLVRFVEASTQGEVIRLVDSTDIDLLVLDGEAVPSGGLGIARQLKDEIEDCPPTCVVIARAADRWLAAYARVDATLTHPLDPMTTGRTIAGMLRNRAAGVPSNQ